MLLLYSAFLMTGDVQEDALITFRTALNFADHGELSFNLGENHSGATSYLYPLWIAMIRSVTGDFIIPGILLINSLVVIFSGCIFATLVSGHLGACAHRRARFWAGAIVALTPISLHVSVRGMEAVYVILLFVIGLRLIHQRSGQPWSYVPVILLPLVRPDAIAFSLILAGCAAGDSRQRGLRYVAAAFLGVIALVLASYLTFGTVVPATMQAKAFGVFPGRSFSAILAAVVDMYLHSPLFSPVTSKYLVPAYPLFSGIALVFSVSLLAWSWRANRLAFPLFASMLAAVWLVPGAFALGGVMFPWYFWPSQFLYQALLVSVTSCFLLSRENRIATLAKLLCALFLFLALAVQLFLSFSRGTQQMGFMASVGKYIASVASAGDSLYLEPAGYIPYYAGLRTIDEVGLASHTVLNFKKADPEDWWIATVRSTRPTFLVQRDGILQNLTYQGHALNAAEASWLWSNYRLIKTFRYVPDEWADSAFLKWILRHGSHDTYHVFKLKEQANHTESVNE